MITLRYHIVSLVAVLLALTTGVIAGTTVISESLVTDLRRQRTDLNRNKDLLEAERDALKGELSLLEDYSRSIEARSVAGALAGRTVVMVTKADVPGPIISGLEDLIFESGARFAGRISLTPKWRIEDETAREQLALALGQADTAEIERLTGDAAARLAARLRSSGDPSSETDLIDQLRRAGFLTTHDLAPGAFPVRGTLFILVSPGLTESIPSDRTFMLPLLRSLGSTVPTVAVEPLSSTESLADRVRGEGDLRRVIATIDHVDTIPGRIALVASLRDLAAGLDPSHYGTRRRTSGVAPSPSPQR